MKKFIALMIAIIAASITCFAQDYKVENGNVIVQRIDSIKVSPSEASVLLQGFFANNMNDVNTTGKLANDNQIVVKYLESNLCFHTNGQWHVDAMISINVQIKNGRMRTTLSTYEAINESVTYRHFNYYFKDAYPLNPKHNVWKLGIEKKAAEKAFNELVFRMNDMAQRIVDAVNVTPVLDEW